MKLTSGLVTSESDTWATPWALFRLYDAEFRFTLDVCATVDNTKCGRFFSPEVDGLSQSWAGERCWMNPPYGQALPFWVEKAALSRTLVVALLPARTDTKWFHQWVAPFAQCQFLKGRVKFLGHGSASPFPSVMAIYGNGRTCVEWRDWKSEVIP